MLLYKMTCPPLIQAWSRTTFTANWSITSKLLCKGKYTEGEDGKNWRGNKGVKSRKISYQIQNTAVVHELMLCLFYGEIFT